MHHILHILNQLGAYGGTPVKLLYQIRHASLDFRYTVCCINEEGGLADRLREYGAEVIALKRVKNYDVRQLFEITQIIVDQDVDLVHTHFARANTYGRIAALLTGRPMIVSEHGVPRKDIPPMYLFDSVLNLFTAHHVSNSYATLQSAKETVRLNRKNMDVIYNGVPDTFGNGQSHTREHLREKHDIDPDAFVVLDVGGHVAWRNHETLVRAARHLREAIPNLSIIQIGDGPEAEYLRQTVKSLNVGDTVQLRGYVQRENVHEYMQAADVYANPALREGFGIATVEAMLAKLPVVCANAGSLPELFKEEEHGLLFSPEDQEGLAEAILQLYREPERREQMGKAARQHALTKFDVERFVRAFESKYKAMVENKKAER